MLDEQSSELTNFNIPFGRFEFLRLPYDGLLCYGLCSPSEVFIQQKFKQIFYGFDGVEVYIDDLIIWGIDKAESDLRLRRLIYSLRLES